MDVEKHIMSQQQEPARFLSRHDEVLYRPEEICILGETTADRQNNTGLVVGDQGKRAYVCRPEPYSSEVQRVKPFLSQVRSDIEAIPAPRSEQSLIGKEVFNIMLVTAVAVAVLNTLYTYNKAFNVEPGSSAKTTSELAAFYLLICVAIFVTFYGGAAIWANANAGGRDDS
ncbi:hypothetical protein V1525DRAFT_401613 [Lipomyces kononenkoae]|uniref:Uncharacterized protein n=1 Tax=Lipomyces kononenkoae TaxID=34357 RepID=A0ACC3T303_LIPKO